jgi:SHS2 domain-containing protein
MQGLWRASRSICPHMKRSSPFESAAVDVADALFDLIVQERDVGKRSSVSRECTDEREMEDSVDIWRQGQCCCSVKAFLKLNVD